jgi:hypothetical protein
MTPDANEMPANGHESLTSSWVSTATAAAHFCVSERTVLRRAAAGKLTSRKATTSRGVVVEIRLDGVEVPTGADRVPTRADRGADTQTTLKTPGIAPEVPTGADTRLLAHLADENKFLRGVVEQLQRDGAETRASLRKALDGQPKQLTSGAASGDSQTTATAPEAPTATAISPHVVLPVEPSSGGELGEIDDLIYKVFGR